jgi:hypothetical protein
VERGLRHVHPLYPAFSCHSVQLSIVTIYVEVSLKTALQTYIIYMRTGVRHLQRNGTASSPDYGKLCRLKHKAL